MSDIHADGGCGGAPCTPCHLAVIPPRRSSESPFVLPRLGALELLVRDFGADINGRDDWGRAPLHWAYMVPREHRARAIDALVLLGADVEARDNNGYTPIFQTDYGDATMQFRLLSHGASANVLTNNGMSSLALAWVGDDPAARLTVLALLRASSRETRRAVSPGGQSAIELLAEYGHWTEEWCQDVICELLSSGVSVKPCYASRILPIAARHGVGLERRVVAHEHEPPPWQVHEAMVELAFDFQDVRAVEEGVRVRERRVRELEEQLRARGTGKEESDESDEEEEGGEGGESGGGG